ncbi:MAG: class I SAM-dependent methyltransferase [Solirubrobacteraceae bacterium]
MAVAAPSRSTPAANRAWLPVFERFLSIDSVAAWPWEVVPEEQARELRLAPPKTNLGQGRGRFRLLAEILAAPVARGSSICDVGAFPGTTLRLIRQLPGGDRVRIGAAGLGIDGEFRRALQAIDVETIEAEFDVRATDPGVSHLLAVPLPTERWDVVVCTEVVEHQLQPLALLVGCNRLLRPGGKLVLTTNSASFIGDVLKLLAGRHNVEALGRSHVLVDHAWRPHMRLYLLEEMEELLRLVGFDIERGRYFDGGNVYAGAKGAVIGAIRRLAGTVPRLRSHLVIVATKAAEPPPESLRRLDASFGIFGLTRPGARD